MKSIRTLNLFFLALGLVALVGCSNTHKSTDGTLSANTDSDAKTKGLGQEESFGGTALGSNEGATLKVGDQTYYFDYDKSEIRSSDKPSIEVQMQYLASHPEAKILLEGHTDPRGSREYNIALGDRRANVIQQFLTLQGVSRNQIRTVSYGAERLASQGHSDEDYQLDRRVHLIYEAK